MAASAEMHYAMFEAARAGDEDAVSRLVDAGAEMNCADRKGLTPLHLACMHGRAEVASRLLDAGAEVDRVDTHGVTSLHFACVNGHLEVASRLLGAGAVVNRVDTRVGATPLHFACVHGCAEVASRLLGAGAVIDRVDTHGATPMHFACVKGHLEVASRLLDAGAEVDRANTDGFTPLYMACILGHLAIVKLCSAHGASRVFIERVTAEQTAEVGGRADVAAWLARTHDWTTRLHHLELLTEAQARAELRAGADIYAAAHAGGATPALRDALLPLPRRQRVSSRLLRCETIVERAGRRRAQSQRLAGGGVGYLQREGVEMERAAELLGAREGGGVAWVAEDWRPRACHVQP